MQEVPQELDARTIPPDARHPAILSRFDTLSPEQGFILVSDLHARPLFDQFQAARAGLFEWNVLEAGPERFRVEIRRRGGEGHRSVSEYLGSDHRRLDRLLAETIGASEAGRWKLASETFAEFACGLNRHIDAEEGILFPRFEEMRGGAHGPTRVMRAEHIAIRELIGEVEAALRDQDSKRSRQWLDALGGDLEVHNQKEEGVLYPSVDHGIGDPGQLDDLVRAMQAI